jgi:lipopolysaccharide/colanic/teichoic acid biosynthesis glycosyltransferase
MSPKTPKKIVGLSTNQKTLKRVLDVVLSITLIPIFILPISILIIVASFDTKGVGLFFQNRVGQYGKVFTIIKIRTFNETGEVSKYSEAIRKYKLDEFPQLFNILVGQMSFVGPRPDVFEVMNYLPSTDQIILTIKPGLTGPASLHYFNEEEILKTQQDPIEYNMKVLFPSKNAINKEYIKNYHIFNDLKYIYKTTLYVFQNMAL